MKGVSVTLPNNQAPQGASVVASIVGQRGKLSPARRGYTAQNKH